MEPFQMKEGAKGPFLFLLNHWMKDIPGLTAGFTGRHGGVSGAPWNSLNLGLHVGDSEHDVVENRRKLAEETGWTLEAWTCAEQVHGSKTVRVEASHRGRGAASLRDAMPDSDGIVTNVKGVLLASLYADCVPLYFYDTRNEAIGLAHAGWKGTAGAIAKETIAVMAKEFGTEPSDVVAAIGPSIGPCCYEVDGPVIDRMEGLLQELALDESDIRRCMSAASQGKAKLDLKEINRQIMIKAGILPSRIEISKWCTGCNTDLFFSHRMEGGRTGRMASFMGMAER